MRHGIIVLTIFVCILILSFPEAQMISTNNVQQGSVVKSNLTSNNINLSRSFESNNFTTINTTQGKLHIENTTLTRVGLNQILSGFLQFVMLQNLARNNTDISKNRNSSMNYYDYDTNTLIPINTRESLSTILTTENTTWPQERTWFADPSASTHRPTLIWGHFDIQPLNSGNYQSWDGNYLEREVYLNNYDGVEFIVLYTGYPTNTVNLGFCIYDDCLRPGDTLVPYSPPVHANNIADTSFDYELAINSNNYEMWWSDFYTGEYWTYYYPDSTMSQYITTYNGASELNYDNMEFNFRAEASIGDNYTKVGSNYDNIGKYFTQLNNAENNQPTNPYVYSYSWFDEYKFTYSHLITANPDPT